VILKKRWRGRSGIESFRKKGKVKKNEEVVANFSRKSRKDTIREKRITEYDSEWVTRKKKTGD